MEDREGLEGAVGALRPALPFTLSSQGCSSARKALRTMPSFLRRASSRSRRWNSLPAPLSGSSSSWYIFLLLRSRSMRAWCHVAKLTLSAALKAIMLYRFVVVLGTRTTYSVTT